MASRQSKRIQKTNTDGTYNQKRMLLISGYSRIRSNDMHIIQEIIQLIFQFQVLLQSLGIFGSNLDRKDDNDGRLGLGNIKDRRLPMQVDILDSILHVSCKRFHTMVVDMNRDVYVMGKNHYVMPNTHNSNPPIHIQVN